uniref:NmrA-like domain-containing protein n=1 Tax=Oryza rufipogon TaxID=4529 RepID=A0A0E0RFN7_ORYRU
MAMEKSRVLIVGGTGYIGRRIVAASLAEGHPTFVLLRPEIGLDIDKLQILMAFKAQGARLLEASLDDREGLVAAIRQVDVVVSAMSGVHLRSHNLMLQLKIVEAIKQAGNVKRFLPSEFGADPARLGDALEPGRVTFDEKMAIRRAIEEANIPHTYVSSNCFAAYFCPNLCQLKSLLPPKERVDVYGNGNVKAFFVDEDDIGTYTVKSIDDPRTLNKTIYIRPQDNCLTQNELIAKWEELTGKSLEKVHIPGVEFLAAMKDLNFAIQVAVTHYYHIFYDGCLTNFDIGEHGAEATMLYPEVPRGLKYRYPVSNSNVQSSHSAQQPYMAMEKSRVLIVGGTGYIGRRIVAASLAEGHPTFVLLRPEIGLDIDKLQILLAFKAQGARLLEASLHDHEGLVAAVRQVDVVVSAMSGVHLRSHNLLLQLKLVEAIKEAGNVKRFLPSEFGMDPSRMGNALKPGRVTFDEKMEIRRAIEDAKIPHTYVSSNCFAAYFCPNLSQLTSLLPPKERVNVYGDGNVKDMQFAFQVGITHFYHIFYEGCLTNFDIGDNGAEATMLYPELALLSQILSRCENSITPCLFEFMLIGYVESSNEIELIIMFMFTLDCEHY